jgi:hypothetical protein
MNTQLKITTFARRLGETAFGLQKQTNVGQFHIASFRGERLLKILFSLVPGEDDVSARQFTERLKKERL